MQMNEGYNENYLNKKDTDFINGFDWAVEMALDNFFDNNFIKGCDDDSFIGHIMTTELPDSLKDKEVYDFRFNERWQEEREILTVADYVRSQILSWCECNRDYLIVSMIDNMSDEEYESIKEQADGQDKAES